MPRSISQLLFTVSTLALAGVAVGCSLEKPEQHRLSVQLVPKDPEANPFSLFSSTPTSLSDINCVGLNIRGGGVGGGPSCNGLLQVGVTAGAVNARPTSFDVDIPTGAATTFEAFGFQASNCPPMGSVLSNGIGSDSVFNGKVYRLGAVTVNLTAESKNIVITTSFDSTQAFHCQPAPTFPRNIVAGTTHTCASSKSGDVYCWGSNGGGELGNGGSGNASSPVQVLGAGGSGLMTAVNSLGAGSSHTCVTKSGSAFCWGANASGQLGIGGTTSQNTPAQVVGVGGSGTLSSAIQIAGLGSSTCALDSFGSVFCWGSNSSGELGNGGSSSTTSPVQVLGTGGSGTALAGIQQIGSGSNFACARSSAGNVYCWGSNSSGQLGNNSSSASSNIPVQVVGVGGSGVLSNIVQISTGNQASHVCAVDNVGRVFCWGSSSSGQIGTNSGSGQSNMPLQVFGVGGSGNLGGIRFVSTGASHTCATDTNGQLLCWGANSAGQLGNNSSSATFVPLVSSGSGFFTHAGGASHTCGIDGTGAVFCWGNASSGQLGNTSSSGSFLVPSQVAGVGGSGVLGL